MFKALSRENAILNENDDILYQASLLTQKLKNSCSNPHKVPYKGNMLYTIKGLMI